ncbi:MAG: IPT/TIG domain-containing protein [Byssovorax sp.]
MSESKDSAPEEQIVPIPPPDPEAPELDLKPPETAAPGEEPAEDAIDIEPEPADVPVEKPVEKPDLVDVVPVDEEDMAAAAEAAAEELPPDEVEEAPPPPRILGVEPSHGPATTTTLITVNGEHFAEGCLVRVGTEDLHPQKLTPTSFELELPPREKGGFVDIRVVNPDQQNELRVNGYHYDPPPRIDRIEPDFCIPGGGASILVLGQDFAEGSTVLLGDVELPVFPKGDGKLEIVVPPRTSGQFDITVKNPDGQANTLEKALCYADPPVVTEIEPTMGVITGGTVVAVHGRAFMSGAGIEVGGTPVSEVIFEGQTRLGFVTPPREKAEPVDITVINPTGLRHTLRGAFTYRLPAPIVASVSPAFGPNAGGTVLTIRGKDFMPGARILVCGIAVPALSEEPDTLTVKSPEVSRSGLVDIVIENPDGQRGTLEKGYRYDAPLAPPVLTTVSPSTGSAAGGLVIALIGENFTAETLVRFGNSNAQVKFLTHKELSVTVPPGDGLVPVEVVNPDGARAVLYEAFTYEALPAPIITGISPVNGPSIGGTRVIIEGQNFNPSCSVYVGREQPKETIYRSPTEMIFVTAPRKMAGVVDVEVMSPGVPKAVMKNGFRYDAVPAPTISSISPNRGGTAGGTELSITGQNFLKESVVLVDGKPVPKVKFVDKSNLEIKMPGGTNGKMVDIVVRNPDGKEAVSKRAFQYDSRYG